MKKIRYSCLAVLSVSLVVSTATVAQASNLTLTAGALSGGFVLSTFADNFPTTFGIGPLGITFTPGGALVADYSGNVRLFTSDADGQHANSVSVAQNYGVAHAVGLATLGGNYYLTDQGGAVQQINSNGTFNHSFASVPSATGIAADASSNSLFVSGVSGLFKVTAGGSVSTFKAGVFDGLAVDTATGTLYAASGSHVYGYNTTSGSQVFDSGTISGGPDGIALGAGSLAGNIFVNTNGGTFYEINLATTAQTLIASGGDRGDFVAVDPNGSLLITQTNSIMRLTAPSGSNFGEETPEPGTVGMLLSGLGLVGFAKRRSR